jgi:hypothetical protein
MNSITQEQTLISYMLPDKMEAWGAYIAETIRLMECVQQEHILKT